MVRAGRPRNHDPIANEIRGAIRNGDEQVARNLISSTEIDMPDGENCTPLIWASFHNRPELLTWILENNGNVDHQDRNGYTALHYVSQERLPNIAQILLNAGAKTELRDAYGNTPLWTASFNAHGDLSVVELLVKHGASFDNVNNAGKSIREMASIFYPDEFAKMTGNAT